MLFAGGIAKILRRIISQRQGQRGNQQRDVQRRHGREHREGSGPLELDYLNLVKLKPGTLVNDRYRLEKLIGQGGFGIVFEALDVTLNSRVAVKFLNPQLVNNEQKFLRVKREINLSRKISDARIVKVFSLESWQEIHFLVMELVAGRSLKSILQEKGRRLARIQGYLPGYPGSGRGPARQRHCPPRPEAGQHPDR